MTKQVYQVIIEFDDLKLATEYFDELRLYADESINKELGIKATCLDHATIKDSIRRCC